ncbi:hypothetical protein HF086_013814 [Spodoptera exigua]|uniref:Uncharacterized protein n=1 Tax=Spodoptera exigua TaxID=7107 RepID=A0A922SIJ6_SPOEX|nr:hypothetical protein HF086_013814 [Spodoptera exigua]
MPKYYRFRATTPTRKPKRSKEKEKEREIENLHAGAILVFAAHIMARKPTSDGLAAAAGRRTPSLTPTQQ